MNQFQSIDEVLSALKRRAWMIVALTFVGCMVSIYFALAQERVFQATAAVQIEDAQVPDQLAGATASSADAARNVQLIQQRQMARDNLVQLMDKFDLFSGDPSMTISQRVNVMRDAVRIEPIFSQQASYAAPATVPSGLLITVSLDDAEKAAAVANEIMASVIDQSRSRSVDRARETLDFFANEEERVEKEIGILEAEVASFKRANAEQLPEGTVDLRAQLVRLRETELDLEQQVLALETGSDRTREDVKVRQVELLKEQQDLIGERIAQMEALLAGAPEVERELSRLERELGRLRDQYEVVTRRKVEAELGQILEDRQATDRFEVLETALPPAYPSSGSRKKTVAIGGLLSLAVGLGAAFLVEMMYPAIRRPAQLERALGIQPVVSIPYVTSMHDRRRHMMVMLGWGVALVAAVSALISALPNRMPWN